MSLEQQNENNSVLGRVRERLGPGEYPRDDSIVGFIRSWEPAAPEVAQIARGGGGPWWRTQGSTTNPAAPVGQNAADPSPTAAPTEPGAAMLPTVSEATAVPAQPTPTAQPAAQAGQHGGGPPWQQQSSAAVSWWSQIELQAWILLGSLAAAALLLVGGGLAGLRRL